MSARGADPNFADAYSTALETYVATGQEHQLQEAYALGRQAITDGMTILGLVDHHRVAVDAVARRTARPGDAAMIRATFEFLYEALSTFEMAQRGYWEAQERARVERELGEQRQQLAQAYLSVDRALELPDRLAAIETAAAGLVGAAGAACSLVEDPPPGAGDTHPDAHPHDPADGPGRLSFPIRDPAGETVAVLTIDTSNRSPVSDNERFMLTQFSAMAGVAVENARQFARERSIALMLQHDLLPGAVPAMPGLDVAVRYLPGEATTHAGGDWYDLFPLPHQRVGLVVGDVTGHGVNAAAAMGQLRMAVLAYALAGFEPADVIQRIDVLLEALGTGRIATMVYIIADPRHGELVVANAGHPPPILIEPDGTARHVFAGHGLLLGVSPSLNHRSHEITPVRPGSHLLLYTDGLIEPPEREGADGITVLLEATQGFTGTADELCDHVLSSLAPGPASDDICILAATVLSEPDAA
jgi:stage II sporulation SpoE-like protein/phosphoserine phosphatase RsbU-like protein